MMKKYIGTKQIEAEPMTRGDAWGKHLLREKPSTENFDDEGYFHLVTVEKSQGELNLLVNIYTALYSFLKVSPWNTIPDTPRMDKLNRRKGTVLSDNSPHTIR